MAASITPTGNLTLTAISTLNEAGGAGRRRNLGVRVQLDINGDAKADMHIELTGTLKLTAGDFVL